MEGQHFDGDKSSIDELFEATTGILQFHFKCVESRVIRV